MFHALQFLILTAAGWINRQQEDAIEYLLAENRVLKEQLGGKRLRLTDPQRRRLAVRGKRLGRQALDRVAGIVTPDTILRWYRKLIAKKYDGSARKNRRPGLRPRTKQDITNARREDGRREPDLGLHPRIRDALAQPGPRDLRATP